VSGRRESPIDNTRCLGDHRPADRERIARGESAGKETVTMNDKVEEFQNQMRDMLRAQQDAYVAAVKAWREAVAATAAGMPSPSPPSPTPPLAVPTATDVTEASYGFAAQLLADQSRFMEALSKAMAGSEKKS
jgi:hypothetical protein